MLQQNQRSVQASLKTSIDDVNTQFSALRAETQQTLSKMMESNTQHFDKLRKENQESLDKINGTVNEKLQKTLDERISKSFEQVSNRLAEVYESLGEMKNVATNVSDLKNVLANVKTRGILGEIQLGAILEQVLTPGQYVEQAVIKKGGKERVDYAIKLPGLKENTTVYLPIDAKFPGDSYSALLSAYETGDKKELEVRRKNLIKTIKEEAKSIQDKYINPPETTQFAVLFLPFEGLYAEAVNLGLVEILQREYNVSLAGPSTMAAYLNSLQMGFKTLALQKKSSEVWNILAATKTEFSKFGSALADVKKQLQKADDNLEKLVGTRTRAINRKLEEVGQIDSFDTAKKLIGE